MKKILAIFAFLMIFCVLLQAQDESTTNKATRIYVGYYGVVGPETHHGPSLYFSIPLNDLKLRLGIFGRSMAWGTYESRGGFLQLSKLMNNPENDLRYRLNLTVSYSVENLVGEAELPHKMLAATFGGTIVYDIVKNLNVELGGGIGYASMVKLPQYTLFKPSNSAVALQVSTAISYRF